MPTYTLPGGNTTQSYATAREAWGTQGMDMDFSGRLSRGGGAPTAAPAPAQSPLSYEVGPGGERKFYGLSLDQLTNIADPWASQRGQYQETLSNLIKDPSSFVSSPLFQSATQAGIDAVNRSAASRGMLKSGNRLQALMDYGQQQAPKTFFQMTDLLSTLAGARNQNPGGGLNAATNIGQLGVSEQNAATNRFQAETGRMNSQNQQNQWNTEWTAQQQAQKAAEEAEQERQRMLMQQQTQQQLNNMFNNMNFGF